MLLNLSHKCVGVDAAIHKEQLFDPLRGNNRLVINREIETGEDGCRQVAKSLMSDRRSLAAIPVSLVELCGGGAIPLWIESSCLVIVTWTC